MPFINEIVDYINASLASGSLNKSRLQPANFYGLSSVFARSKKGVAQNQVELLPAIIDTNGKDTPIVPDSKKAMQIYHKLLSNVYSTEKSSYGDSYLIKSVTEVSMVVITNSELTGINKEKIEPVVVFGLPQRLSDALIADLKIARCLITPISSNMDHVQVFATEYPRSDYFLSEQVSMFSLRYRIEMVFSQACVEQCLCD
jgi:hypothetical protein